MTAALSNPIIFQWLSTLAISFAVALLMAGFMSIVSHRILRLQPEFSIWVFVVGFAFLASLATVSITPADSWTADFVLMLVPTLAVAIYFLPSLTAAAALHPAFKSVFILNLLFGWTIIGWFVAITWTLRRPQQPAYRVTPFGAVAIEKPNSTHDQSKSA